jgi:hypothetical protein
MIKKYTITFATIFSFSIATVFLYVMLSMSSTTLVQKAAAFIDPNSNPVKRMGAPLATSGNNVYIVWWSNKTGNNEVMFRASTDGGKTFGDKMNLSNTPNTDSSDANIAASGNKVYITWWERNSTSNEPVARISIDTGHTFGPLLYPSQNGIIGNG